MTTPHCGVLLAVLLGKAVSSSHLEKIFGAREQLSQCLISDVCLCASAAAHPEICVAAPTPAWLAVAVCGY